MVMMMMHRVLHHVMMMHRVLHHVMMAVVDRMLHHMVVVNDVMMVVMLDDHLGGYRRGVGAAGNEHRAGKRDRHGDADGRQDVLLHWIGPLDHRSCKSAARLICSTLVSSIFPQCRVL
jgi:hypothetical protein